MAHSYTDNRHYVIMPYSMAKWLVDFDEVLETSIDTVRKSVDGTKTFVKYVGEMPPSVAAIEDKSREYNYPEIMAILGTTEWTPLDPQPE